MKLHNGIYLECDMPIFYFMTESPKERAQNFKCDVLHLWQKVQWIACAHKVNAQLGNKNYDKFQIHREREKNEPAKTLFDLLEIYSSVCAHINFLSYSVR